MRLQRCLGSRLLTSIGTSTGARIVFPSSGTRAQSLQTSTLRLFQDDASVDQNTKARRSWGKLAQQAGLPLLSRSRAATEPRVRNSVIVTDVDARHTGCIKILSLNETASMNALSRNMLNELSDELHSIEKEALPARTRALVIASESEKAFCAGQPH